MWRGSHGTTRLFLQEGFDVRFEWGLEGVRALALHSDVVVIIDVLSFTTCVDVVLDRGGMVFPYPERGTSAQQYAWGKNAILAGKRGEHISLSPASLTRIDRGTRIVLPSPNGATCSFQAREEQATVIAACLRNASAVADWLNQREGIISVIAAGERWADGSLRPALEDLVAAGAVISQLKSRSLSPEARTAVAAFYAVQNDLPQTLAACGSGRELIARGFTEDITIAAQLNISSTVPILDGEGAFVSHGHRGEK